MSKAKHIIKYPNYQIIFLFANHLLYEQIPKLQLQQMRSQILTIFLISIWMAAQQKIFLLPEGFTYISDIDPSIRISANYATPSNFRGQIVTGYLRKTAIISTIAGQGLRNVQKQVNRLGYDLVIYDSYRPQKAVYDMVGWASQPQDNKTKAEYYPYIDKNRIIPDGYLATKSGHSRGSTIDLSIIKSNKQLHNCTLINYQLADGRQILIRDDGSQFMCGHFDLFDLASHHDINLIDKQCLDKRNTLRNIMNMYGFNFLKEEWWHYTFRNQPFPTTYFDFNVE